MVLLNESSLFYVMVRTPFRCILSNKGVLPCCRDERPFNRYAKTSQFDLINKSFRKIRLVLKFKLLMAWIIAYRILHLMGGQFWIQCSSLQMNIHSHFLTLWKLWVRLIWAPVPGPRHKTLLCFITNCTFLRGEISLSAWYSRDLSHSPSHPSGSHVRPEMVRVTQENKLARSGEGRNKWKALDSIM